MFAPDAPMVYLFPLAISSLALLLLPCTVVASEQTPYKPLIARVTKDHNTSLYTISIKNGEPLVVDLAGSLVWSTCPYKHGTVPCESDTCRVANQQHPRRCRYVDAGWFGANRESGWGCACTGHPFNSVTGECSIGDLTSMAMSANTTNGTHMLYPESFTAVGSCAPDRLSRSLPEGATGVAGFSRWQLSLPSQLSSQRKFGNVFALCLPGFATFGNTSVYLGEAGFRLVDYTGIIPYTPLLQNPRNPGGYYIPVKGISVSWHGVYVPASLPGGVLDLDVHAGRGGVVLSTVTYYTIMRPDVFRPFARAFDEAITRGRMTDMKRVPAVKPFELCYNGVVPLLKRPVKYDVPLINMELAGATGNWTVFNDYLVHVEGAMCLGILEMGPGGMPVDGEPSVVVGGKMLENNLLVFDLEKGVLGFSMLLDYRLSSCYSTPLKF
ncbi:chitinase CLP-like [Phragmites australis]|uniref:chitinase CLP-like n=1 Tax=Phragmites australis TaxID=29695 RepID=UPI002D798FDA|nr:chitinase CLP-like [Phragmites australis]